MRLFSLPVMRWFVLITAILIWVNVYAAVHRTKTIEVPVSILNVPTGLAVADLNLTVEVQITGRLHDLHSLQQDRIKFAAQLPNLIGVGEHAASVSLTNAPANITITDYNPKTLLVHLETIATKEVPVLVAPQGLVADGFNIRNILATPANVTISGAASIVDSVSQVYAEVTLNGENKSFTSRGSVMAKTSAGQPLSILTLSPPDVAINVDIAEGSAIRNLGIQPAFSGELPGGFWVEEVRFSPVTVMVTGNSSDLSRLAFLTTTPINLSGRTGRFTERVAVSLPNGVATVAENIIQAEVVVRSSDNTRSFNVSPSFTNITEGYSLASSLPAVVEVVVSGAPERLNGLTRSDILLQVDLAGSLSGTNTVKLTDSMIQLPDGVALGSFEPQELTVVLSRQN